MPLSPRAIARLKERGFSTAATRLIWESIWDSQGEAAFEEMLGVLDRSLREAARLAEKWHPRLVRYAQECRERVPAPDPMPLTLAERTQVAILGRAMRKWREPKDLSSALPAMLSRTAILSTSPIGLNVIREVFSDWPGPAVFLTTEERQTWFADVYDESEDAERWYFLSSWDLITDLSQVLESEQEDIQKGISLLEQPIPDGATSWFLSSGTVWGELAGSGRTELWLWDGRAARYVDVLSCWVS